MNPQEIFRKCGISQEQEYFRQFGKLVYNDSVKRNVEVMMDSSECRKYLVKNAESAPMDELLIRAVECIYDLTGDSQFRDQVIRQIERRTHG